MPDLWKNDPDQKTNHREDARRVRDVAQQLQQFIVNTLKQTRAKGTNLYEWAYQYGGLGQLARQEDPEIKRAYFGFRKALQNYMSHLEPTAVNQFKQQYGENPLDWNFVKLSRRSKMCSRRSAAVMEIPDLVALADMREHFSTGLDSDVRDAVKDHEKDLALSGVPEGQPEYETERDTEPEFEEPGSIFKKATLDFRELGKQGLYPLDSKYFPKKGDTIDFYDLNGDKQYGTVTRVGKDSMNIRDNHTKKVVNQKFYRVPALAQQPPVKKPTASTVNPGDTVAATVGGKYGVVTGQVVSVDGRSVVVVSNQDGKHHNLDISQVRAIGKYHDRQASGRSSNLLKKRALAQEGLRQHGDYGADDTYAKQMNDENAKQADGDINDPDYGSKGSYDQKMNEENSVKTAEGVSPQAENILNDPQLDYIVECYGSDDEVLRKAIADHFGPTFSAAYPNVDDWAEVAEEVVQAINHSGISKESVQSAPGGSQDPQEATVQSADVALGVGNYDMGNLPDHR
jgi:hypothetical protein